MEGTSVLIVLLAWGCHVGISAQSDSSEDILQSMTNETQVEDDIQQQRSNMSTRGGSCPSGWKALTTGCYKITSAGTHQQSITNCKNAGGYLVEIDNQEEQNAIASFTNGFAVWFGATDTAKDGEWVWGHSGKKVTFTKWNRGEPNGRTSENCINKNGDSSWNDLSCRASLKGVCELRSCPSGWKALTTGCYKITSAGTHQQSITNCKNAGGYLVEINNQDEQNAIAGFTNGFAVWFGATDTAKDGEWVWGHSGRKVTFTKWNRGEPNGRASENCINKNGDSTWNDLSCSASLKGVCELNPKPTVESSKDYGHAYRGSLLLENACEGKNPSNYWLTPGGKTGEEAYIILNLGKVTQFNRFKIKNTHNGNSNDRGAKNVGLYTSNSKNGPWKLKAEKLITDARNKGCNVPLEEVTIAATDAQFIKLVINSYYGYGGGLKYLGVDLVPAIDGGWSSWGKCSKPCKDNALQKRTCSNPTPQHGGKKCVGSFSQKCNQNIPCPIDGGWSSWGKCSKPCKDNAAQTRTCSNPTPQHGGKNCAGSASQKCNQNIPCPIAGGWNIWSKCSETCSKDSAVQTRKCDKPKPEHGGAHCSGSTSQKCNQNINCGTTASPATCPPVPTCPPIATCPDKTCPPIPSCPTVPPTPTCPATPTCPTKTCPATPTCPAVPDQTPCPAKTCPPIPTCPTKACPPIPTCPTNKCPPTPTCPTLGAVTTTTSKTSDTCDDTGCKNAFNGLGMCVDTSSADWVNVSKTIDFSAGIKDGKCSKDCNCNCFKHTGCYSDQCDAKQGICLIPEQAENRGFFIPNEYKKAFPCNKSLNCYCYIKDYVGVTKSVESVTKPRSNPSCKQSKKCTKKNGKCFGKGDNVPRNAKKKGWCNKKAGCKCYKV